MKMRMNIIFLFIANSNELIEHSKLRSKNLVIRNTCNAAAKKRNSGKIDLKINRMSSAVHLFFFS